MPIDTSIYNMLGRGVKSVNDYDNEHLQTQQNALAVRGDTMKVNEMQRSMQEQEQVRNALSRVDPMASDADKLRALRATNTIYGHTQANAMEKAAADIAKERAAAEQSRATAQKTSFDTLKGRVGLRMEIMQNSTTPMQALEYGKRAVEAGHMTPQELMQGVSDMPNTPEEFARWRDSQLSQGMEYGKRIEMLDKTANELMVPDPKNPGKYMVNEPLVGAKARVAQAGAQVSYGSPVAVTMPDGTVAMVQPGNRPGAQPQIMTSPVPGAAPGTTAPLRPAKDPAAEKPLPEAAQKQVVGARNLQDAVDKYLGTLSSWSNSKMLNPNERATMGNAYNNMMLQAKEAYNLGVLNGPDYEILQSVVKDPTKWTSAAVDNKTLGDQATSLKGIAKNIERTVLEAHGKKYADRQSPSQVSPPAAATESGPGKKPLSSMDQQAADWAAANPNDPRAAQIKKRLGL